MRLGPHKKIAVNGDFFENAYFFCREFCCFFEMILWLALTRATLFSTRFEPYWACGTSCVNALTRATLISTSIMWLLSAGRSSEYSARREYLDDVYSDVVLKINDEWLDNHQKHSWLWWADFIAAITGCAVAEEERRYFRRYLFEAGMVRLHGFFRLSPRSSRIRDARWNE